jgi:hypothetical protein
VHIPAERSMILIMINDCGLGKDAGWVVAGIGSFCVRAFAANITRHND